jgi:internalin A
MALQDFAVLDEISSHMRIRGTVGEMIATVPEFILPIGSKFAYALDEEGYIVGLRLLRILTPDVEALIVSICKLSRLQRLVLFFDVPVAVPERLFGLSNLRFLALGGEIKKLPPALLELDLAFIGQADLYSALIETDSIAPHESVQLGYGQDFPNISPVLKNLVETYERTDLNESPQIPEQLREQLKSIRGISIESNSLEDPPVEIVRRGRDALIHYYQELGGGLEPLLELKVILVGMGGSGKTSLIKRLMDEPFDPDESQTHGINIRVTDMNVPYVGNLRINFWDFGGQEIMHATHQFFLSKRSLYLLVLDGRKEEDPEYWLQHIESFGGNSPILIVLNKIDENAAYDVNRRFLMGKYPGIRGFARVSCRSHTGMRVLQRVMEDAIKSVPTLQTSWPRSWFEVKRTLENMSDSYITLERYNNICMLAGVEDPEARDTLVDFLHDLGVILHFNDMELLDTHVLDPRWVTEAVYRIITSEILAWQKGILPLDRIGEALTPRRRRPDSRSYAPEKYQYVVDLMLKFELAYRLSGSEILLPDLLDIQEPVVAVPNRNLIRFVFQYNYLPKSVILRFIVRMHHDIKGSLRWRTGVVLEDPSMLVTALVTADEREKRLYLYVGGEQTRDYFSVIRKVVRDINSSFEKLSVTEQIPLPDAPEVLIDYQELIGYELAGRHEIFIGRLGRGYDVTTLLSGLEKKEINRRDASPFTINVQGDVVGSTFTKGGDSNTRRDREESTRMSHNPQPWEKVLAYAAGSLVVGLVGYLAVRNEPFADPNIVVLLRTVLSLSVALFGATIPGMLRVDFSAKGLTIRALGALALFVITFLLTPQVL